MRGTGGTGAGPLLQHRRDQVAAGLRGPCLLPPGPQTLDGQEPTRLLAGSLIGRCLSAWLWRLSTHSGHSTRATGFEAVRALPLGDGRRLRCADTGIFSLACGFSKKCCLRSSNGAS
jgi:hypothetical protein